jgi:hypothetical protein
VIKPTFRSLIMEALRYFAETGFRSESDLQQWLLKLHAALEQELPTNRYFKAQLNAALSRVFSRDIKSGIANRIPGVSRYTLDRIAPNLRAELDRRIYAGVDLIKLNKAAATQKALQRFAGWVSSVPPHGIPATNFREIAKEIIKPVAQVKYEARRVAIDQSMKLSAAVAHTVAMGEGAIAGIWHDRGEFDHGYDARPIHLARSGKLFLTRDSWALNEGLITKRGVEYYDDLEDQAAVLPYCSCYVTWVTSPRDIPETLLTAKGWEWVRGLSKRNDSVERLAVRSKHIQGLNITIETARGETRFGAGPDGEPWLVTMPADYGYLKWTNGADGEQLDCYIGPNPESPLAWVIDQIRLGSGAFDEQKAMLGFTTRAEAVKAYELGFSDGMGRARIGSVREMTIDELKRREGLAAFA